MDRHPHGDNTLGVRSSPRRATLDVQLDCRETTKYPGIGVLRDFLRGDTGFYTHVGAARRRRVVQLLEAPGGHKVRKRAREDL